MGLRRRIGQCFELAALPGTPEEDRKRALRFIVVGGGPTGAPACPEDTHITWRVFTSFLIRMSAAGKVSRAHSTAVCS